MALIAVSGHPGCRYEEVARISALRLGFELLTQARIATLTSEWDGLARHQELPQLPLDNNCAERALRRHPGTAPVVRA